MPLFYPSTKHKKKKCLQDVLLFLNRSKTVYVGLGFTDLKNQAGTQVIMGTYRPHPKFDTATYDDDISLIELEEEAVLNSLVEPIALARRGSDPADGTTLLVSGWGSTSGTKSFS